MKAMKNLKRGRFSPLEGPSREAIKGLRIRNSYLTTPSSDLALKFQTVM